MQRQLFALQFEIDQPGAVVERGRVDGLAGAVPLAPVAVHLFERVGEQQRFCLGARIALQADFGLEHGDEARVQDLQAEIHLLAHDVGDALLGRVIDPLGNPLDGEPAPRRTRWQRLESGSPPIVARDFVKAVGEKATGQAVTKSVTPQGQVDYGAPLTYTIDYANLGDGDADNVTITDPLPGLSALACVPAAGISLTPTGSAR